MAMASAGEQSQLLCPSRPGAGSRGHRARAIPPKHVTESRKRGRPADSRSAFRIQLAEAVERALAADGNPTSEGTAGGRKQGQRSTRGTRLDHQCDHRSVLPRWQTILSRGVSAEPPSWQKHRGADRHEAQRRQDSPETHNRAVEVTDAPEPVLIRHRQPFSARRWRLCVTRSDQPESVHP